MSTDAQRTDWAGVVHAAVREPPRIASVVPSLTELVFALGLGDALVARTGFCVHPRPAVRRVPKIGGTKDFDLAALERLRPTHLVVNVDENRRDAVAAARAFVPHVIVTDPCRPEDNARLYTLLGAIFDREREAAALGVQLTNALARLDTAVSNLARERVLYVIWKKPWMTIARDTYIGATLARGGWDTLPEGAPRRYPEIADDDAVWTRAERILLASEPFAFRERDVRECEARRARPALRIDAQMTSWYGPRAIAGLDYLAALRRALATTARAGPP
jgi:ABC-type Fe3+-hydroxamate transport system substrate-binding protein